MTWQQILQFLGVTFAPPAPAPAPTPTPVTPPPVPPPIPVRTVAVVVFGSDWNPVQEYDVALAGVYTANVKNPDGYHAFDGIPQGITGLKVEVQVAGYQPYTSYATIPSATNIDLVVGGKARPDQIQLPPLTALPAPPPPPAPPAPTPAPPSADMIDLSQTVMTPRGVDTWKRTTQITRVSLQDNGFSIDFDAKDRWANTPPPGWDGGIQFSVWLGKQVAGVWHLVATLNCWKGEDPVGGTATDPNQYGTNLWYLDPALAHVNPAEGEQIAVMVSSGAERGVWSPDEAERSNVVVLPFSSKAAVWSFPLASA